MEPESTEHELTELRASLRAMVEYHRAMGMKELLCPKGEGLAPLEPLPQRTPVVSQDHSSEALSPKAAAARLPARDTAEVREPASRRRSPPAAATLPAVDPAQALAAVERELEGCIRCRLSQGRNNIVFGAGSPTARLAFVGEGPGRDEDLQGIPFVGAAGQLLDKIIEAMGLDRDQVFICNVVKCRPPDNRNPQPDEQATCSPFLERQLEIVRPEVIVALGAVAASYLLETERPVGRLRGRFHYRGDAVVMPTYHPAYLLRTPSAKRAVWEDMKLVRDRLGLQT